MAQNIQFKVENEEGTVIIHTAVFRRLIEEAMDRYADELRIGKYIGNFPDWIQKVTRTEYLNALDFTQEGDELLVSVTLIIRDDSDFDELAEGLISCIKDTITERTGVPVRSVELVVSGIYTANGIVAAENVSYKG